jgi:hypothetical protein
MSLVSVRRTRLGAVMAALALVLVVSACGGDGDGGGTAASSPAPGEAGAGSEGAGRTPGGGGQSGDGGETAGGTGGNGGAEATPAPGARFNLVASPDNAQCSYVPNGHLSGADLLNVHFYFLIIGGNPPDAGPVRVAGTSDTGLSAGHTGGPHNQAETVTQFALRPEDFGRSHNLTITVDPQNQVPETDESDNRIRVSLSLPSPRPSSTVDPLPCSVTRAS